MFRDREAAEPATARWLRAGRKDDVSLADVGRDPSPLLSADPVDKTELGTKAAEGAGVGGVTGGALGALLMGLRRPGSGSGSADHRDGTPGGGAGRSGRRGDGGGNHRGPVGWGIPEERARLYDEGIRDGGIVVGVTPRSDEDAEYLEHEWTGAKGEQIHRPIWGRRGGI